MKLGSTRLHGVFDVGDRGEDFVFDVDQRHGFLGGMLAGGGNGRHRMTLIQDLFAGEDVVAGVFDIDIGAGGHGTHPVVLGREVRRGDNRSNVGVRLGLTRVY